MSAIGGKADMTIAPLNDGFLGSALQADGILVEFTSVVEAVRCAVEIQRGMAERNVKRSRRGQRIEFRVGINVGDIIIEGDDIYGDGVNVAARLGSSR